MPYSLIFRITIALLSTTYFQPDEYFQALEPAHHLVFQYGHLTWEWSTQPPIRSIVFPILFAPIYYILKASRLDGGLCLILAPKLVQGLFASITDVAVSRLARNILGERYVSTTLFLSLTSIFHIQALSRTLSNSLETSLTTLALSQWPFMNPPQQLLKPLLIAASACMIRPTNAVIWTFLMLELTWRIRHNFNRVTQLWLQAGAVGTSACTIVFLLDSWYFGIYTFTPLNFLITNLSPVSTFYGRSPWHYYLFQAIPTLCNVTTPFFLHGMWQCFWTGSPPAQRLATLVLWTIGVYSLTPHKEWRFIHPLLPVMHVLASKTLVDNYTEKPGKPLGIRKRWRLPVVLALLFTPYLLFVQSRAQIAVMHYLRYVPIAELRSVGFLMPCHSTPWQSHLHRPHLTEHTLWALGCEPPTAGQNLSVYQDQSDIFYASPIKYLQTRFPATVNPAFPPSPYPASIPGTREMSNDSWEHSWPSHLVIFGALLDSDGVKPFLEDLGYREEWNGWNGWEQDWRRRGGVRVWTWKGGMVES